MVSFFFFLFLPHLFPIPGFALTFRRGPERTLHKLLLAALISAIAIPPWAASPSVRPKILGIASVHFVASDLPADSNFFRARLSLIGDGVMSAVNPKLSTLFLRSGQTITLSQAPAPPPSSFLVEITLLVDDLDHLRAYLKQNHIAFQELPPSMHLGGPMLSVIDPEGHTLNFVANAPSPITFAGSPQIIHAGIIVHDRVAIDHFYKDILGFHVYWEGGKTKGTTNWVAMQVPEGTNWIEYMMNEDNSDKKARGIMNHISIGVPSIKDFARDLKAAGVELGANEQPRLGLDGKWQLNLYDADDTRIEFMEFAPVEKPCCSDYTGPHPQP